MKILSDHLRQLRAEKNLTQAEVAAESGIAYRSYRRYEGEDREPIASVVVVLAKYYGVSSDYLLGLSDRR